MPGKLQLLIRSPQSLAFVAGQAREEGQDMNRSQEDGSEGDVSDEDPEPCWLKNEQARRNRERDRDWLQMLQKGLGVKVIQDLPDATSTASELEYDLKEDEVSITSHEFGVEPDTDADVQSSDGEGRSSEEELLKGEDYPGRRHTYFQKSMRQKVNRAQRLVQEMAAASLPEGGTTDAKTAASTPTPPRPRRPGP